MSLIHTLSRKIGASRGAIICHLFLFLSPSFSANAQTSKYLLDMKSDIWIMYSGEYNNLMLLQKLPFYAFKEFSSK